MSVTREDWAKKFLEHAGWPTSQRNVVALVAWQAAEGSPAKWNPLATTQSWEGDSIFNDHGVRHYRSLEDGLKATLKTLKDGDEFGYRPIRTRFRNSDNPRKTLDAVEASSWGTGGLAKSIVDDVKRSYDQYASQPIGQ